jgi:fibronectin type 3 domain-containing protein
LWEDANRAGYVLERVTLMRDGSLLATPERRILTPSPAKPVPLNSWENAVKNNKYAAIAGQALYGKTFEMDNKTAPNLYSVITKVQERDTRFSFALFSADQSPEVAKLSGLWYTDKEVRKNEKYLYRVFVAGKSIKADTGFVYTSTAEFQPLPVPLDLKANFGDRKVELSWNQLYFRHIYTAYILERSNDGGKTFKSVSPEPLVNLVPTGKAYPEQFYITDSVPENSKIYHYRVRGLNSFGETSEPSEVVSGAGHPAISFTPYITENYSVENNKVSLNWEFPKEKNIEITGFKMARSSNPKTGFVYIEKNISPESRQFTDLKPLLTNYYVISAFNKFGDEIRSMPVLVQLVDSVPPLPPVSLKGEIDTTGKVTVRWKPNKEEDIYGYRIYRSNYAQEEFSQITSAPVHDTIFIDHINLKTLTRSVFYRIMAIDKKQNHSQFSEPLELKRPDRIAPVPPVFKEVKSSANGVYLKWINSTSTDVKSHLLYRSIAGSKEWELIAAYEAADSIDHYTDTKADSVNYSSYTLIAKDFDNNESTPVVPVTGKKIDSGIRPGIDKLFTEIDREKRNIQLAWKKPEGTVYRYLIYRANGEAGLTLYKSIPGVSEIFTDTELKVNTRYQYSIKVVYANGSQSVFCKPIAIDF